MPFGLRTVCALAIAAAAPAVHMPGHADPLTVKTEQGKVHGKFINARQVRAFLGIPYAAPPVGDLRWRPPAGPQRWSGVRDATRYGHRCMQGHQFKDMIFQDSGPSEDCLFLNVFTPAKAKRGKKLPVMFWIHGGGYQAGSASEPRHDGDYLPRKGVVLVTINYRLGVFGFFATPGLAKEGDGAAGNYGLMDMVAALKWVHANIREFGGDPDNVTIFGESAGSFAVSTLMAATPAQPYFQKAIGESGGAMNVGAPGTFTLEEVEDHDQAWMESLDAKTLAEQRALSAQAVLDAALKRGAPRFSPVVDGKLLNEPVAATYAAGRQAHIPLLAGWNQDESTILSEGMTAEKWRKFAQDHFKDRAAEFLRLFPGDTDDEAVQSAIAYDSARFIALGTWVWIEAQRKTGGAPVYRYHFELPAPPSKFHLGGVTFHSDDIEYVFGTLGTRPGSDWRPEDLRMSDVMMTYWTNFAKDGNPNGPGAPDWPPSGDDDLVIHLNKVIAVGPSSVRAQYEFLREVLPPRRQ
ncbi:MAG TPA: carboxylesterase family protein [Terracidiphilus sp.]|nr:carboxylesterase family protein [Terracidiphilus sp.]